MKIYRNGELIAELPDDPNKLYVQNFRKSFSKRLREARKAANLTQEELANKIGIKRSTYGQFEQGRNEPNISVLPQLARELNKPIEWLLGLTYLTDNGESNWQKE